MISARTAFCLVALLALGAAPRDITVPPAFQNLERAPVPFDHDKHTAALQAEGCQRCHPADATGAQQFTFPKVRDERTAKTWMNSFHDACLDCHQKRTAANQKAGPLTCGECHRVQEETRHQKYAPVLPTYYDALRDTYHKDCLACHREQDRHRQAKPLDWQSFYVKEQRSQQAAWPKVAFDYVVHDKHTQALEKKCDLCHYLAPERRQQLAAAGKEPAPRDWVLDPDPARTLTDRDAAHRKCLNCHLTRTAEKKKAGPLTCGGCHAEKVRPAAEVAAAPRSQCEQKDKVLIALPEGGRAKGVPFNHKTHETASRSCQECHHQTVRACRDCHTLAGTKEGGGVTLAEAYHRQSSSWSCVGCHATVKRQPNCAGCHDRFEPGLVKSACNGCHTGTLTSLEAKNKLPAPGELLPADTKEKLEIAGLRKEYKPSTMPHLAIAKKLTDLSNESPLASWFHRDPLTICAGCHHHAPLEKGAKPPTCATCHPAQPPTDAAQPSLLGAYHQQCLGCHQRMVPTEKKLPQNCTGCHAL